MRNRVSVEIAAIGLVLCAAIAGCHKDLDDSEETGRKIPRIDSLNDIHAPLNQYFQNDDEESEILRARTRLAGRCLKRYGLPAQSELTDPVTGMVRNPVPLYLSENDANRYGYRAPAQASAPSPSPGSAGSRHPMTAPERKAVDAVMNGWGNTPEREALHIYRGQPVTRTGCLGESDAHLMENTTRPRINGGQKVTSSTQILNLILALKSQATDRVERDARFRSMITSWASCMRKEGYAYKVPADARGAAAEMAPAKSGGASERERRLADRDAVCQQKVNYLGVTGYLTELYQKGVVKEYRETLTSVRENLDQRVAAAQKINRGARDHAGDR